MAFVHLIVILMIFWLLTLLSLKEWSLNELQLNKANSETPLLFLLWEIFNSFVSSKIYYKRFDFDYGIVNFPFLDADVLYPPFLWCLHFSIYLIWKSD